MKRTKSSIVFAVSLVLSLHAQWASAESGKGPLTPAERTQCLQRLTEFNQGVRAYNAELDKLRALKVEIDALRAVIEKDEAAMDRRDNAAMDALNAQIGKNNELVERHNQMSESITLMANENKPRGVQFREECENRPPAPPPPVPARPADSACSSATGAKGVQRQIEATFAEMRVDEKQRQAEVESVAKAREKEQAWTSDKRGKVWLNILGSPKFMAFEREKQPYVQELMRVLVSKPKNGQDECRLIQRIAATLPAIKAINTRQYAFMADQIRAAK